MKPLAPRQLELMERAPFRCDKETSFVVGASKSHIGGTAIILQARGYIDFTIGLTDYGKPCKVWHLTDLGKEALALTLRMNRGTQPGDDWR